MCEERVFQTSDGDTRIFIMPFTQKQSMWQLTFRIPETKARALSAAGPEALRAEALRRCAGWHAPIPIILRSTDATCITGYPVYDHAPDAISAEDALSIGFINDVVAPDRLLPRAMEFADRLKRNAPVAVAAIKEAVLRTSGVPLEEAYGIEAEISARVTRTEDAREGPRAFMEKREPVFTGR